MVHIYFIIIFLSFQFLLCILLFLLINNKNMHSFCSSAHNNKRKILLQQLYQQLIILLQDIHLSFLNNRKRHKLFHFNMNLGKFLLLNLNVDTYIYEYNTFNQVLLHIINTMKHILQDHQHQYICMFIVMNNY